MKISLILLISIAISMQAKVFNIEVNETLVEDVVDNFRRFGKEYMNHTKEERKELMSKLCDAFRNTGAKLILNFGKTIAPVVSQWAEIMKEVQVNDECDQDCAVGCLDPKARSTMFFDPGCLRKCNCKFSIQSIDKAKLAEDSTLLAKSAGNLTAMLKDLMIQNQKTVWPALKAFLAKEKELYQEFGTLLKSTAEESF